MFNPILKFRNKQKSCPYKGGFFLFNKISETEKSKDSQRLLNDNGISLVNNEFKKCQYFKF